MKELVHIFIDIFMYGFILSTLFGAGLELAIKDVIEPIKNIKSVIKILLINYILIPLMAYGLTILLHADEGLKIGILIISCCAGADFLPKLIVIARGSLGHAVGFMFLLMVATSVFAPIILPIAIPGISVNPLAIARPLVVLMLLPLSLGLTIRSLKPSAAEMIHPVMKKISTSCLIITAVLFLSVRYDLFISAYGTGVFNMGILYTVLALLLGFILAGGSRNDRIIFTLGSGARNMAAALLIASANFPDPRVITVAIIVALVQFIFLFLSAYLFGRTEAKAA